MDTSRPIQERRERRLAVTVIVAVVSGGDRRNGGFNRDRQGGFNHQGGAERRPQGGRPANRPAAPAAPARKEEPTNVNALRVKFAVCSGPQTGKATRGNTVS